MEKHTSTAIRILQEDDILDFVMSIVKPKTEKEFKEVFLDIVKPMFNQYVENPKRFDYIAFNQENGFCFLEEKEVLRKKHLVD